MEVTGGTDGQVEAAVLTELLQHVIVEADPGVDVADAAAVEVEEGLDLWEMAVERLQAGMRLDYLICDEAQFYTALQIDQLAAIVDDRQVDLSYPVTADASVRFITDRSPEVLGLLR